MSFYYWLNYILILLKKFIKNISIYEDFIKISVRDFKDLQIVLSFLKMHSFFKFNTLVDLVCIDTLRLSNRFVLNYILLSVKYKKRLVLTLDLNKENVVSSVINLFSGANWMEREVWDLFGIFFFNHTDLRRILTDYGFNGYPFRKDFPLNGFFEIRFDENKQYLVYEPIELMQNLRFYDFVNPFYKKCLI